MHWDTRLKDKIKSIFGQKLGSQKPQVLDRNQLEATLFEADFSAPLVEKLLQALQTLPANTTQAQIDNALRAQLIQHLPTLARPPKPPAIIYLIGVNGAGKTTTTAKLAHWLCRQQNQVMLAAADTFRAAAADQLRIWANRLQVPILAHVPGSDPAAVVYEAVLAMKSRQIDYLLIDTGGRLHTNQNLLGSLQKMQRTALKAWGAESAPIYNILIIDATLGQNSLQQALSFNQALPLHGLIVTKLDGIARAGSLVSIYQALKLPIWFIGSGEGLEDFTPFNADSYISLLLGN